MVQHSHTTDTEHRRGTVLFVDITGYTTLLERYETDDLYDGLVDSIQLLEDICRHHGGTVERCLGDALYVLFGVPQALEDGPRRAVNAAIEMHRRIRSFSREHGLDPPIDIHTGINTGRLIAGDVIGSAVRDRAVIGDCVNVASRLSSFAPSGTIVIGHETYLAVRDDFELKSLGALELKGKTEKVRAYEVLSREPCLHRSQSHSPMLDSPMLGRDAELGRLAERVEAAASGRGGIATVIGHAGTGKTRLIAELADCEAAGRVSWLVGRSVSTGATLSFHPFADLLRSWLGIGEGDDDASSLEALEKAIAPLMGEETNEIVAFMSRVMRIAEGDESAPRLDKVEGEGEKLVAKNMAQLLRGMARAKPMVLVFEDAHWADGSSLELLGSLLRLTKSEPILFLLVARPDQSERWELLLANIRDDHADVHCALRLEALDRGAAELLIDHYMAGGDVPVALRGRIEERTGGNPFFIEQTVRSLVDDGTLRWENGALWLGRDVDELELPGTIDDVITARIDRLEHATKRVLQVASVIGRTVDEELLANVTGSEQLDPHLETLRDLQFLSRRERAGRAEVVMKHPLIHETAYKMIRKVPKREYHQLVAETIESLLPSHAPGRTAMLAYHFSLGTRPELAEEYLFRAGDEAARIAASTEALHFFESAYETYKAANLENADPTKMAMLEKKIALATSNRGDFIRALDHFDRALELLGEELPKGRFAVSVRFMRTLATIFAEMYVPHSSKPLPRASALEREVVGLLVDRARAQTTAASTRFVFDCMDGLRKLRKIDASSVERPGSTCAGAVGVFSFAGLSFGISERFLERGQDLLDENDLSEQLFYGLMRFIHKLFMGDWSEEYELPEDLITEGLRLGQLWDVTTYLGLLAQKKLYQGRFREASEYLEQVAKIEDLFDYEWARRNRLGVGPIVEVQRGRLAEAHRVTTEYLRTDETVLNIFGYGMRSEIRAFQGDDTGAREDLASGEALLSGAGFVSPFHVSNLRRAKALLDVADYERRGRLAVAARLRAERSARRSLGCARKLAWDRPQAHRVMGTLRWVSGRKRSALRWWKRSIEHAVGLKMRPELARTLLEAGRRMSKEAGPSAPGSREGSGGPRGKSGHFERRSRTLDGLTAEQCLERARSVLGEVGLELRQAERGRPPAP